MLVEFKHIQNVDFLSAIKSKSPEFENIVKFPIFDIQYKLMGTPFVEKYADGDVISNSVESKCYNINLQIKLDKTREKEYYIECKKVLYKLRKFLYEVEFDVVTDTSSTTSGDENRTKYKGFVQRISMSHSDAFIVVGLNIYAKFR